MNRSTVKNEPYLLNMINVKDALNIILDSISSMPPEDVKLTHAQERILAKDVRSDIDIPTLDNSAMDGYAVKASNTHGASRSNPKVLTVVEDLRAGYLAAKRVEDGKAIRIMTGAPIPKGADSVIMVEYTKKIKGKRGTKEAVEIYETVKTDENIRRKGEDIKRGERVLPKGILLNSAHIGILASLGKATVKVTRKPKVAILATGDEMVDVDKALAPGKLRSSNTYTLYSQILKCGGIPKNLGIARDKPEQLEAKLRGGLDCDLIITSGGVSVGDYDLVKFILAKMGTDIKFWKVAMRPGKPIVFGKICGIPVFGLPGNPVSSIVSFEIFVRPTILKMLGCSSDSSKEVDALLEEDIKKKRELRYFLRAETRWENGTYLTRTTGPQGSGVLKSMAIANSLIILPEGDEFVGKGSRVTARFLY